MAVDVSTETVIARPAAEVAAFAADPDNAPRCYVNRKSVEWQTPRPLAIGSRIAFVAQFLGRRLADTCEIVEWTPGARLVMRTADGPFPMETTYEWRAAGDGSTHMTLRNRGNRNDVAQLKKLLERPRDGASVRVVDSGGCACGVPQSARLC